MEMNAAINSLPLANAGQLSAGAGKTAGATDASANPFGSLLQTIADPGNKSGADQSDDKKATNPLLLLMMAISGGLTQAQVAQLQLLQTSPDPGAAAAGANAGTVVQVNFGCQTLPISLQNLPLTNGQLAALLQSTGAAPSLLNDLLADPQGQPAQLLSAQPDLLPAFAQAFNQAVQAALTQPVIALQDPQAANLIQSVLAQLTMSGQVPLNQSAGQPDGVLGKQSSALGKLQATMSAHLLQATTNQAQGETTGTADEQTTVPAQTPAQAIQLPQAIVAAGTLTAQQPKTSGLQKPQSPQPASSVPSASLLSSLAVNTLVQQQSPQPVRSTASPVVMMQANQFQSEFQDLMVKSAAYIESPGSQEFRIVLQPQGLGQIEVHVQAANNQLTLHFAADSAQAKGLLDSGLSGLRSQLEAQGIRFDRIEITTAAGNGGFSSGLPQERSGQSFQGQSGGQSPKRAVNEPFSLEGVQEPENAMAAPAALDGIDVMA